MSDFNIYDSIHVLNLLLSYQLQFDGPLHISERMKIDSPSSSVDLIIYELGAKGEVERTTASGRKVMYPEREQQVVMIVIMIMIMIIIVIIIIITIIIIMKLIVKPIMMVIECFTGQSAMA